jgi:hypothetical protein
MIWNVVTYFDLPPLQILGGRMTATTDGHANERKHSSEYDTVISRHSAAYD